MKKSQNCKECGSPYVVNKKFMLCETHNNIRLHGKPFKTYKSGSAKLPKKNKNNEFRESKRAKDGLLFCEGCEVRAKHLDVSHLIPVSIRKDLENDDRNKQMLCRNCHDTWEHNKTGVENLFCYKKNLFLIQKMDPQYYYRNYGEV